MRSHVNRAMSPQKQTFSSSSSSLRNEKQSFNSKYSKEQSLINQSQTSNQFNSSIKNMSDLTEKSNKNKGTADDLIRERIMKRHLNSSKNNQLTPRTESYSRDNDLKRNTKNVSFGPKPTIDNLIGQYAPNVINSLSFTRSNKPINRIFIKNKYAQLF